MFYNPPTGVYAAIVTPFDINGDIDLNALTKLLNKLHGFALQGFIIGGSVGEGMLLNANEITQLVSQAKKTTNLPILVGTGSFTTREAIAKSCAAEEAGADGLLVMSPPYSRPNQEELYQYFKKIAENVNIPIVLYDYVEKCATEISFTTVKRLAEIPNIVGIKTISNMTMLEQVVKELPEFGFYCGYEVDGSALMQLGAKGFLSALAGIAPQAVIDLYNATAENNNTNKHSIQAAVDALCQQYLEEDYIQAIKKEWAVQGVIHNVLRAPLLANEIK